MEVGRRQPGVLPEGLSSARRALQRNGYIGESPRASGSGHFSSLWALRFVCTRLRSCDLTTRPLESGRPSKRAGISQPAGGHTATAI